jgi:hypothetical protein
MSKDMVEVSAKVYNSIALLTECAILFHSRSRRQGEVMVARAMRIG